MSKKWYNYFVSVGGSDESQTAGSQETIPNAAQTVAEIAASLTPTQPPAATPAAPVANGPASPIPDSFAELYQTAGIVMPAHGYTIEKVTAMLESQHIRNLPAEVKRSSILVALDAAGVKVQEIVEDAIRRDRALDAFERVRQRALDQLETEKARENQQLQVELDKVTADYRARMQANTETVTQEKGKLLAWQQRKRQEEERIAEAVAPFVTENPITRG